MTNKTIRRLAREASIALGQAEDAQRRLVVALWRGVEDYNLAVPQGVRRGIEVELLSGLVNARRNYNRDNERAVKS
jgi:hypothetical protein